MIKNDFISLFSDAIQFHEGWSETNGASYPNLNPGNLNFDEQPSSTQNGRWAKFPDFYYGKEALHADISAKLEKLDTIRDIISLYAPPSENDTEAYINSVITFFSWRNVSIAPDQSISELILSFSHPVILLVINKLYLPPDWHAMQRAISQCASYMPHFAFSTRYSDIDLSPYRTTIPTIISPNTAVITAQATIGVIQPFFEGQPLAAMIYDGSVMLNYFTPAGGCEYQADSIPPAPVSAVASVLHEGPAFSDPTARQLFHELIHELFKLTEQTDILHTYLMDHSGYNTNSAADLLAVFSGNNLNTPSAIAALTSQEQKVAQQTPQ